MRHTKQHSQAISPIIKGKDSTQNKSRRPTAGAEA